MSPPSARRMAMPARQPDPLRLPVSQDDDYVQCFQQLCALGIRLRRGRSPALLLQKALVELRLGSLRAARDAAQAAIGLAPRCVEGHWLRALACLLLCMQRLGLVDEGPVQDEGDAPAPAEDLLAEARHSLVDCARLTRRRDEEAVHLLDYLDTVLSARLQGDALAHALCGLVGLDGYLPPRTPVRGE